MSIYCVFFMLERDAFESPYLSISPWLINERSTRRRRPLSSSIHPRICFNAACIVSLRSSSLRNFHAAHFVFQTMSDRSSAHDLMLFSAIHSRRVSSFLSGARLALALGLLQNSATRSRQRFFFHRHLPPFFSLPPWGSSERASEMPLVIDFLNHNLIGLVFLARLNGFGGPDRAGLSVAGRRRRRADERARALCACPASRALRVEIAIVVRGTGCWLLRLSRQCRHERKKGLRDCFRQLIM